MRRCRQKLPNILKLPFFCVVVLFCQRKRTGQRTAHLEIDVGLSLKTQCQEVSREQREYERRAQCQTNQGGDDAPAQGNRSHGCVSRQCLFIHKVWECAGVKSEQVNPFGRCGPIKREKKLEKAAFFNYLEPLSRAFSLLG